MLPCIMNHASPLIVWLVHLLFTAVSVVIVASILPGMRTRSFGSAIWFALAVGFLNMIAWGFLGPLTVPFKYVTLGIGGLVVNGIVFLVSARLVGGVEISGCFTAAIASVLVTAVNWGLHFFLDRWLR
jgi:putative membrane protein